MIKEYILEAWMAAMNGQGLRRQAGMKSYVETARVDGLSLYTSPATAQRRPAPSLPYVEEPGLSWFFEDAEGHIVDPESGRELIGPYTDTFAFFEERHGPLLVAAEWSCYGQGLSATIMR